MLTRSVRDYDVFRVILPNCQDSIPRAMIITEHVTDAWERAIVKIAIPGANCPITVAITVLLVHYIDGRLFSQTDHSFLVAAIVAITRVLIVLDACREAQSKNRHCACSNYYMMITRQLSFLREYIFYTKCIVSALYIRT